MAFINHGKLPVDGYWGPITSTLLWCEEKYEWSKYVAEPANTFTNIFFIVLASYGAYKCVQQDLLFRFVLVNLGIAGVGVGSFLFHMTLQYSAQLLDELPMIYVSALLTYSVCETAPRGQKPKWGLFLPLGLLAVVLLITVGYLASGAPVFHQVSYAFIQLLSTIHVIRLLYSSTSPLAATPVAREQRIVIRRTFNAGVTIFLTGFLIWNIDNFYCNWLRSTRKAVGFPLAHAINGHAWWHIFTGLGAYLLTVASCLLVLSLKEAPENFVLKGSTLFPHVERVKPWDPKQASTRSLKAVSASKIE